MGSVEMSMPKRFKRIYLPGNSRFTALRPSAYRSSGNQARCPISRWCGDALPYLCSSRMKHADSTSLGSRSLTNCSPSIFSTLAPAPLNFSVIRIPSACSGKATPVGWYWTEWRKQTFTPPCNPSPNRLPWRHNDWWS